MTFQIEQFTYELKKRKLLPTNIQFSTWQNWNIVSCFSEDDSLFISEKVTMGIDRNPNIALMKGLTEFCERRISNNTIDPIVKLTTRSDGIAALPKYYSHANQVVQEYALNEAIERYLWANWWDDNSTNFTINHNFDFENKKQLMLDFNLEKISSIQINPTNYKSSLLILIAKIKNKGYVTGGASGNIQNKEHTFSRAFGELLRHLITIKKMLISNDSPSTFYEKRLYGFGSGEWNKAVEERLQLNGSKIIELPNLVADREIEHENSDFIILHRCLFQHQPIFMGGDLERLCI